MNIELCLFSEIRDIFHIFQLTFLYRINSSCNLQLNLQLTNLHNPIVKAVLLNHFCLILIHCYRLFPS